ncbi:uncharacterized protein LOC129581215 [Paramacrobiotus metropolitanus]|uniref:uncharacterized protein LOC129581215 n=1 Tax=Paramacrobiotus metropolitanus TaxID=2943436 RepID=UPI0024457BD4|nr:uncharacterized protein LOC129581215 [Paramacrobiotus metropolitanus]
MSTLRQIGNMGERNCNAKLQAIATIGFDAFVDVTTEPVLADDNALTLVGLEDNFLKPNRMQAPQPCLMDHPKLLANNFHFLQGIDTEHAVLSHELAFADGVATRSNPTTLENLRTKLTTLPPNFSAFSAEQQEAFCRLVDAAEVKHVLKYELKKKEKLIRDLELKYLTTDFGLGNVVNGWDLPHPGYATERQMSTARSNRRKIKDSDRIFSASSVMSFISATKLSRAKQTESRKKKREVEKIRRLRKKQMHIQRQGLNAGRDKKVVESEDDAVALGAKAYSWLKEKKRETPKDELLSPATIAAGSSKKKAGSGVKKSKNLGGEREAPATGKHPLMISAPPAPATQSAPVSKPDKPVETGHRLRTLLTNKTPRPAAAAFLNGFDSPPPPTQREQSGIKLKISRTRFDMPMRGDTASRSPTASISALDSNPETPSAPGFASGLSKRHRGRPPRRPN